LLCLTCVFGFPAYVKAESISVAVLDFEVAQIGTEEENESEMIEDLLSAYLSEFPNVQLVERVQLKKVLDEQSVNLSGLVESGSMVKIGQMLGARVLITGRKFMIGKKIVVTSKLIDTQKGTTVALYVEGEAKELLVGVIREMSMKISQKLNNIYNTSMPEEKKPNLQDEIGKMLEGEDRPIVTMVIYETSLGIESNESVVENQLVFMLLSQNISVKKIKNDILSQWGKKYLLDPSMGLPDELPDVDIIILGQAVGKLGLRTGDLITGKGNLKLVALDAKRGEVLAVSSSEKKALDVTAREAVSKAFEKAFNDIALEFIPRFVKKWNNSDK